MGLLDTLTDTAVHHDAPRDDAPRDPGAPTAPLRPSAQDEPHRSTMRDEPRRPKPWEAPRQPDRAASSPWSVDALAAPTLDATTAPSPLLSAPWGAAPDRSPGPRRQQRRGLGGWLSRPASPGLRRARRILWRWRFALAAALFGLAATLALHVLRPPPPPTVDIAITARPIAVGTQLTSEDVVLRPIAADAAPPGVAHAVHDLLGRVAVVGLPAGAPLHATLVSDDGVSAAAPRGSAVVPVRLSDDAVAALLRPGDRVDLLAGTTSGIEPATEPRYLARDALVLPVPPGRAPEAAGGLLGPASEADRPVTLVAVSPQEAPELSAVSGWGSVTAVLVP
ncbi:RcpC/CpaB family pilus assembly protein [Promicromonospora sp. NPDC050880]|uniref:Flp pilus assembly protein CpaB n=1 Tax=Promicromonospora sp. NPDC050880 TaxID=3364406 RepID=UPI0037A1C538